METNWEQINEKKRNNIMLGMAINAFISGRNGLNPSAIVEAKETEDILKRKAKKLYKCIKEIHKELKDEGENI